MPVPINKNSNKLPYYFLLILLVIGLVWLKSSYGKLSEGTFVNALGKTLEKFAAKNPYPWYKSFLENVAIPNSTMFGLLTMWGEFTAAVSITISSVILIFTKGNKLFRAILFLGLVIGMFLNAIFWLAAGWTSASTDSLNLLMLAVEAIAAYAVGKTLATS